MLRAIIKLCGLIMVFLVLIGPATLVWLVRLHSIQERIVQLFFRLWVWIMGIRIHTQGHVAQDRPLLLVTNHCSYLDICVIAATYPVAFTPKSDIKYWPIINIMAMCGDCVFVERKPSKLPKTRTMIEKKLLSGKVICLFPEGTTSEGDSIKPFKSGFFSLAETPALEDLKVQSAALAYTHADGEAITVENRRTVSWVDDMALVPHLISFLKYRSIDVTMKFHEAVSLSQFDSRKALCQQCEQWVDSDLKQLLKEAV